MSITPTRRSVVRTAAWAVPAVTVAGAAPQLAASTMQYDTIVRDLTFSDDLGNTVTANVTAYIPLDVHPGEQLAVPTTTALMTITNATRNFFGGFLLGNPAYVGGTAKLKMVSTGVLTDSTTAELTITTAEFPSSGLLSLDATGAAPASTIPVGTPAGQVTLTLDTLEVTLTGYEDDRTTVTGSADFPLVKIAGNDYTLGTFTVHDA